MFNAITISAIYFIAAIAIHFWLPKNLFISFIQTLKNQSPYYFYSFSVFRHLALKHILLSYQWHTFSWQLHRTHGKG